MNRRSVFPYVRMWPTTTLLMVVATLIGGPTEAQAGAVVDTLALARLDTSLTQMPSRFASIQQTVASPSTGVSRGQAMKAENAIRNEQLMILKSSAVLMQQVNVGARDLNTILSAYSFGQNLAFTSNPLTSPTLVRTWDRYGRFLDVTPALLLGVLSQTTKNRQVQLNWLAISTFATQAIHLGANVENRRARDAQLAFGNLKGVSDFLEFNRFVYNDVRRLGQNATAASLADSTLVTDIDTFMNRYGTFPLQMKDSDVLADSARFVSYVREAVPLMERFEAQLLRVQNVWDQADAAIQTYETHPLLADTTNTPAPGAQKLATDARNAIRDVKTARDKLRADWQRTKKALEISPAKINNFNTFYSLEELRNSIQ